MQSHNETIEQTIKVCHEVTVKTPAVLVGILCYYGSIIFTVALVLFEIISLVVSKLWWCIKVGVMKFLHWLDWLLKWIFIGVLWSIPFFFGLYIFVSN